MFFNFNSSSKSTGKPYKMILKNSFLWQFCLFSSILFLLGSCLSDKGKNIPDVSSIEVDLNIKRFEKDLFTLDTTNVTKMMAEMSEKYPDFFQEVFLGKILPPLQDSMVFGLFVKTPEVRKLYDTCQIVFSDFDMVEKDLEEAFRFYKHYFPERNIPTIITYLSEYTLGNFTLEEDMLGIGLDFFLGPDYPKYNLSFFPKYVQQSMTKDHLVTKSMHTLVKNLVDEPEGDRLLDLMINNGKSLYILDHLLPHTPDHIKMQYTPDQFTWCQENELQIWAHFLKEDLLYSTRMRDIRKLVDYSPDSPGMPPEAPGRTANWMGWQIVKAYMNRNPQASMEDLLALKDAQQLLEKSKYKPQRQ